MAKSDEKTDAPLPSGILLINKPKGITSFDVIRRLRRTLGVKKMGHAGTLDPLAEGLMIIGVGKGTKELTRFVGLDKTYRVDILLGIRTATGDLEGEILEEAALEAIPANKIENVLQGLVGEVELRVPRYSAMKRGGTPLYKRARRGEDFEPPVRMMNILAIDLIDTVLQKRERTVLLSMRMRVASGVYVRSVAEEVGRRLGVPATVASLVREKVGPYTLSQAQELL